MVDLGGGVGHVALSLARTYPRLRIVLQDRAEVIVQAQAFFGKTIPSGRFLKTSHPGSTQFIRCPEPSRRPSLLRPLCSS